MLPAELVVSHCSTAAHVARLLELQCGAADAETNLQALDLKNRGNAAFEAGNPGLAEDLYTQAGAAINLQPSGALHFIYGNRSAVRLHRGDVSGAIEDAHAAAAVGPSWAGAYLRAAEAHSARGDLERAMDSYNQATFLDSSLRRSKSIQRKLRELQNRMLSVEAAA
eukprot:SM000019S04986  [mRNA]  locus=s19:356188:357516:- [translate_table: standard]